MTKEVCELSRWNYKQSLRKLPKILSDFYASHCIYSSCLWSQCNHCSHNCCNPSWLRTQIITFIICTIVYIMNVIICVWFSLAWQMQIDRKIGPIFLQIHNTNESLRRTTIERVIQLWQRRPAAAPGTPALFPGNNDAKLAPYTVQDGQQYHRCSAVNCTNHCETRFTDNSLLHRLSTRWRRKESELFSVVLHRDHWHRHISGSNKVSIFFLTSVSDEFSYFSVVVTEMVYQTHRTLKFYWDQVVLPS